jgi:AraC-like DNA-binding protein
VVLAIIMLVFVIYASASEGVIYQYAMQVIIIVLICYLLWRVETLSDLSISQQQSQLAEEPATIESEDVDNYELPQTIHDKIGALLQQHCIDTRLYLQHDLTIIQLSKAIGTNRFYLSQYFSSQGLTYNAYINNLRINHFIGLYHKAVATQHNFTAKQLAFDSGYRNYQTFSLVFKQLKGQTVTAWMRDTAK